VSSDNIVTLNKIADRISRRQSFNCPENRSEGREPFPVATWKYEGDAKTIIYEREAFTKGGLAAVYLVWTCQEHLKTDLESH